MTIDSSNNVVHELRDGVIYSPSFALRTLLKIPYDCCCIFHSKAPPEVVDVNPT